MPGNIHAVPQEVLQSWPPPNYVDPVTREWLPGFATFWQILSTILVWSRFWLHGRRLAGSIGLDDAFLLIGWIFSVALTACAWLSPTLYGVDRHTWDVRVTQFTGAALIAWIAQVLMLISTGATKAAILLFYRRMVTDTLARRWMIAIYAALVFHALYIIGVLLALLLVCRPLEAYWMSYDFNWHQSYQCAPANAMNPVVGVLSVISDLYAVALPCLILQHYDLGVNRRQRIGLNLVFATGTLVAGAGIARTFFLIKLGNAYDTSWVGFDLYVWTIIECQLAIVCASAPSCRALFRRYLSDTISRTFGSSQSRTPGGTRISTKCSSRQRTTVSAGNCEDDPIQLQILTKPSLDTVARNGEASSEGRSTTTRSTRDDKYQEPTYDARRSSRPWYTARDVAEINSVWAKDSQARQGWI